MTLADDSPIFMRVSPYSQAYIQNKAQELMNSRVKIFTPDLGGGTYDPVTGDVTPGEGTFKYEGPARIWEVPGGQNIVIGEEEVTVTQTYLSIPYWVMPLPEMDDVIAVLESDDPDLVGRTVIIQNTIRGGGLRASRRFQVQVSDSKKSEW
jgi:hypothetical protein